MTRHHLDVKGSDRQDVGKARTVLSLVNAALFRIYFPDDENKIELANMLEAIAIGHQVLNSRKIEDKSDPFACAYRFHIEKQEAALDRLYHYMQNCQWISRSYQQKTPKGNCKNFKPVSIKCTKGVMITINSTKNLHRDLKENYDTPYLMTSRTDTDPLESEFGVIRGTVSDNVPVYIFFEVRIP